MKKYKIISYSTVSGLSRFTFNAEKYNIIVNDIEEYRAEIKRINDCDRVYLTYEEQL